MPPDYVLSSRLGRVAIFLLFSDIVVQSIDETVCFQSPSGSNRTGELFMEKEVYGYETGISGNGGENSVLPSLFDHLDRHDQQVNQILLHGGRQWPQHILYGVQPDTQRLVMPAKKLCHLILQYIRQLLKP